MGGGAAPGARAGGLGNLDWLRTNPQFQQLRQVVQQQPQMLEPILQTLGNGNPDLARLISEYPDDFLQLLSEDGDGDMPLPPGAQSISVTQEESEAISRVRQNCYCLLSCTKYYSLNVLVSTTKQPSKRTSYATRTKSLQQISCSISLTRLKMTRLRNRYPHMDVERRSIDSIRGNSITTEDTHDGLCRI